MSTPLEFITLTKGIEYLLAIAFLFTFVGFWQWQHHQGKGLLMRVLPVVALAVGFGSLASTCISTPAVATSRPEGWASVDDAHYLANIYGPAKFAAHEMGPDIISCQTCHHHSSDGQPSPCKDCHTEPFDGKSPDRPGLKAAYHQRCMDCHQEAFSGPLTCARCHTEKPESAEFKKGSPSPAVAPSISHPLLDRYANCFGCHNPEGLLPLPGNHSEYKANVVCLGCHKPSEGGTASQIPAVSTKTTTPEATPTPTPPGTATASKITHPIAGRENCMMCHGQGIAGAGKVPADHAGRGNESCQLCHKPA